jgi:hypothetical protein
MQASALFERRDQKGKWLFVVAAVPAALFAFIGIAYGAFLPYAAIAAICIAQVFYPTIIGWAVVLAVAVVALASYGYAAVMDIVAIGRGSHPGIFMNQGDTLAFLSLLTALGVVVVGLIKYRPRVKSAAEGRSDA